MPHRQGWIAAVECAPTGRGTYRVIEQPSATNGWRVVVRADDTRTRGEGNHPSLTVWAVPGQ